jgi:ankyrin repeat protein
MYAHTYTPMPTQEGTALHIAVRNRNQGLINLLIKRGADVEAGDAWVGERGVK